MVPKTSGALSCLLPARFGLGSNHRPDLGPLEFDPDPPHGHGDIGESPVPVHRAVPAPVPPKRASFTTFFAFSSKRKAPVTQAQAVPGRWLSGTGQTDVQLISPSAVPSPLRTDDEEYYYSYYTSLTPTPSHPDATASERQQNITGNPDLDSQPSHTQIQHPYAHSTPLNSAPSLRHVTSQTFRPPSGARHQAHNSHPHLPQPQLKTSVSTPNLASETAPARVRSIFRKRASTNKRQERWLSAESWWDALLSPSPRFKVNQAPRPHPTTGRAIRDPVSMPVQGEPHRISGVTFPSLPASRPRPRAVSVGTNVKPTRARLTRSRSATDLGQPSTSAIPPAVFEPALETLVDEPLPMPDPVPGNSEPSSPEPPLSLEQVIDERQAFEEQRAQWRRQAYKSIGNRHTRSFSRARSKSLGEKHVHGHRTSEGNKSNLNLEFLAARSLLGSQSTRPTVHVVRPSNSSTSRSKAYSHSHSQSSAQTSHSHTYSHSHSHSITVSNSSKSSRHPREHSRSGSWSRTALLKAGSLCGIARDDSITADEKVPSSSRADVQGSAPTNAGGALDASKTPPRSSVPIDEVGIAISSTPPSEGSVALAWSAHSHVSGLRHQGSPENRWSSKHSCRSSEYAGPHPSEIDSNLPQLDVASNVSLRHRLPPRPTIYPPIALLAHPYRSAYGQPEQVGDEASDGPSLKVTEGHVATELGAERTIYSHTSLTRGDLERYGVGETGKQVEVDNNSSIAEFPPSERERSLSCGSVVSQHEESDTASSAMNSPPSLTSSTIQMVMSAFDDPDDLDEFQDLFYKPHPDSEDQRQESAVVINHFPTDVHSSASSSPLTHLVRKLSERVGGTPSDPVDPASESGTKFVFMDLASSMDSSLQVHRGGDESTTQPVMVIPEDVDSSYATSVLESPSAERENDTFGYPVKHGRFEVATAPSLIRAPLRMSSHVSVQDGGEAAYAFLSPVTKRYGLEAGDGARTSYVTTSDVSRISGLLDFPLPPSALPGDGSGRASAMRARLESTVSEGGNRRRSGDGTEVNLADVNDRPPSDDVKETLRVLRTSRTTSDASYRTFGGSEDMDFITRVHQADS